jgi:hypothetical protein
MKTYNRPTRNITEISSDSHHRNKSSNFIKICKDDNCKFFIRKDRLLKMTEPYWYKVYYNANTDHKITGFGRTLSHASSKSV